MKTLADLMREGDPLARDHGLSDAEASAIRRRVVMEGRLRDCGSHRSCDCRRRDGPAPAAASVCCVRSSGRG